jgi:hypothetical protein
MPNPDPNPNAQHHAPPRAAHLAAAAMAALLAVLAAGPLLGVTGLLSGEPALTHLAGRLARGVLSLSAVLAPLTVPGALTALSTGR